MVEEKTTVRSRTLKCLDKLAAKQGGRCKSYVVLSLFSYKPLITHMASKAILDMCQPYLWGRDFRVQLKAGENVRQNDVRVNKVRNTFVQTWESIEDDFRDFIAEAAHRYCLADTAKCCIDVEETANARGFVAWSKRTFNGLFTE